jgi:VCBS repeat-containing protein
MTSKQAKLRKAAQVAAAAAFIALMLGQASADTVTVCQYDRYAHQTVCVTQGGDNE